MSSLTTTQKIGQLFFIGIPGPELDSAARELLAEVQPGGVCLFARNIKERQQTRELLDGLRAESALVPFLSVDQEGGLVDRLRRVMTPMPAASKLRSADDAAQLGSIIGEALRILGFNMNFAPVVDIIDHDRERLSNGLHSRAFGTGTEEAIRLATGFMNAMEAEGILGCLKHFPGLGASEVDSHKELPEVAISTDEFQTTDLAPYKQILRARDVPAVMVAHAAYTNVGLQEHDQNGKLIPSSLSPAIISELLRGELGYKGLVLTDDLEMGAIVENYGMGQACKMAIAAGADMLAICASVDAIREGHAAIVAAVESGDISENRIDESIARISSLKRSVRDPRPFDNDRLDELSNQIAELNARLN